MTTQDRYQENLNREISLRSENLELKKEISSLQKRLIELEKDKKFLSLKLDKCTDDMQLINFLQDKVKKIQTEYVDFKKCSYELIENQKKWLISFEIELEKILKDNTNLENQLLEKNKELMSIKVKYNRMMNTKTMKWTGKYWKLLKKIN